MTCGLVVNILNPPHSYNQAPDCHKGSTAALKSDNKGISRSKRNRILVIKRVETILKKKVWAGSTTNHPEGRVPLRVVFCAGGYNGLIVFLAKGYGGL